MSQIVAQQALNQYCVFGMDSSNLLNVTFDSCNSIQLQNVNVVFMLFLCWTSVADSDTALSQQRDKSMGTLIMITFDKQISIFLKVLKVSGDF